MNHTDGTASGHGSGSRRLAVGTVVRVAGETVAKLASVAFFVVLARELGEDRFGDFVFALALAGTLLIPSGLGTDQLLTREVARNPERLDQLYGDVVSLKLLVGAAMVSLMTAIVVIAGYDGETVLAMTLIGLGNAFEVLGKTLHAVLQAFERQRYIAGSLVVQRMFTACVGIGVLLAGGGLLPAAAVFATGALLGLTSARWWLGRRVIRPRWSIDRSKWWALTKRAAPFGFVIVVATLLYRVDATLLGFLTDGTDNAEVGAYGAATRLVFAVSFLSWAVGGVAMPWISRRREGDAALGYGYELGLKALLVALVPVAVVYGLLAEDVISIVYGSQYEESVVLLQIFAAMAVLYAISSFTVTVMVSRGLPGRVTSVSALVLIGNVIANLILIPLYGAIGAAAAAVASGTVLAIVIGRQAATITGAGSPARVALAPLVAGACLAIVLVVLGLELDPLSAICGGLAYVVAFVLVERWRYPEDLAMLVQMMPRTRG